MEKINLCKTGISSICNFECSDDGKNWGNQEDCHFYLKTDTKACAWFRFETFCTNMEAQKKFKQLEGQIDEKV